MSGLVLSTYTSSDIMAYELDVEHPCHLLFVYIFQAHEVKNSLSIPFNILLQRSLEWVSCEFKTTEMFLICLKHILFFLHDTTSVRM